MKTATLNLKRKILVIEAPEGTYFEVFEHGIYFKDHLNAERKFIEGSYTLLGSPDDLKEEDVKPLVESWESVANDGTWIYENYLGGRIPKKRSALESFNSALSSEIYWKNPFGKTSPVDMSALSGSFSELYREDYKKGIESWQEAETRTFDRTRTLIFVEN